jgi:hypothetical protein
MPYSPLLVRPMRDELTSIGVQELLTPQDVDAFMAEKSGTALLVVNSVCGCAAGMARARGYLADIPPSSPSIALFKDGELVHFIPRHRIEGRDAHAVAADLKSAFDEHCAMRTTANAATA